MSTEPGNKHEAKAITTRAADYSQWYLDIIDAADLAEHAPVKGCMVIKPYGYSLWERMQAVLDTAFKAVGVQNAYFPLLIPERLLHREEEHVEGFAPEVAVVTHAGGKKLEENLIIRPTSETIIYETFSGWIQSHRDLPLLINQWANVVRWEMRTRLFLRTTEFLWQEGHTVHATEAEADERARMMLDIYRDFAQEYLAIPVIAGEKSESEKFAGAFRTYCVEAMMQDGKALQFGTSHNLGQNFAKPFNVKFLDENGETQFGWQTSWGVSTRMIGGLIMAHSDDAGLIVPPKIAPVQLVITTIGRPEDKESVDTKAGELTTTLKDAGIRVHADIRDRRPGEKFFEWEKKGVPLRLEFGPKDMANNSGILVRRDTGEKETVDLGALGERVSALLEEIQAYLYQRALDMREAKSKTVDTWDEFVQEIEAGNFVYAHWCGDAEVEKEIKTETAATIRCIPFDGTVEKGICIKTGRPSAQRVLFARAY
ncbi:MAG: proline--tRNA ligase [Patescibacteria group bacterium]